MINRVWHGVSTSERFLAKINSATLTGCWLWTGHRFSTGYGCFEVTDAGKRKKFGAHRYSYEYFKGPIPPGLVVMHSCDNPPCVNPDHLSLGTHSDNITDMHRKGRGNLAGLALGPQQKPLTPDDPRHGTRAGYRAHRRLGEEPCESCVTGNRIARRSRS